MFKSSFAPDPKAGETWRDWANRLIKHINSVAPSQQAMEPRPLLLSHMKGGEKTVTDGLVMYNPTQERLNYTHDNAFHRIAEFSEIPLLTGSFSSGKLRVETGSSAIAVGGTTVSFASPFASAPVVIGQLMGPASATVMWSVAINSVTASNFWASTRRATNGGVVADVAGTITWIAVGAST